MLDGGKWSLYVGRDYMKDMKDMRKVPVGSRYLEVWIRQPAVLSDTKAFAGKFKWKKEVKKKKVEEKVRKEKMSKR